MRVQHVYEMSEVPLWWLQAGEMRQGLPWTTAPLDVGTAVAQRKGRPDGMQKRGWMLMLLLSK